MPTPEEYEKKLKDLEKQMLGGTVIYPSTQNAMGKVGTGGYQTYLPNYTYGKYKEAAIYELADLQMKKDRQQAEMLGFTLSPEEEQTRRNSYIEKYKNEYINVPTITQSPLRTSFVERTAPISVGGVNIPTTISPYTQTGEEATLSRAILPTTQEKNINWKDIESIYTDMGYSSTDSFSEAVGIRKAYEDYIAKNPNVSKQYALSQVLKEIGGIKDAPTKTIETPKGVLQQAIDYVAPSGVVDPLVTAFVRNTKPSEIPDYTPTQMAYLQEKLQLQYNQSVSDAKKNINQNPQQLVEITLNRSKDPKQTIPKGVAEYIANSSQLDIDTNPIYTSEIDALIKDAMENSRYKDLNDKKFINASDVNALAKVVANQTLGTKNMWITDPVKRDMVLQNADKYMQGGILTESDLLGNISETGTGWLLRSALTPFNALSATLQPVAEAGLNIPMGIVAEGLEAVGVLNEADYIDPMSSARARQSQRAKVTPDFTTSPMLANIALNKGYMGEFQDAADALDIQGATRYVGLAGAFAGELFGNPDFAIAAALGKGAKTYSSLSKAQKALWNADSLTATEKAYTALNAAGKEFLDDFNAVSYLASKTKTGQKILSSDVSDVRMFMSTKVADNLMAKQIANESLDYETALNRLVDENLDTTNYAKELSRKVDEFQDYNQAVKATDNVLSINPNYKQILDDLDLNNAYINKAKQYEGQLQNNKQLDELLIGERYASDMANRISELKYGRPIVELSTQELDDVQKLITYNHARALTFEATPQLRQLDGIQIVTQKTWAHKDSIPQLLWQAKKSDLGQVLTDIRKTGKIDQGSQLQRTWYNDQAGVRQVGQIGDIAKPIEVSPFFRITPQQSADLRGIVQRSNLSDASKQDILMSLDKDVLFVSDFNRLNNLNIDNIALITQKGISGQDISRLSPRLQKMFLDSPQYRQTGLIGTLVYEQKIKMTAKQTMFQTVDPQAIKNVTSFEQGRLITELNQEASVLDDVFMDTTSLLMKSPEYRALYVTDANIDVTFPQAMGMAIVGPKIMDGDLSMDAERIIDDILAPREEARALEEQRYLKAQAELKTDKEALQLERKGILKQASYNADMALRSVDLQTNNALERLRILREQELQQELLSARTNKVEARKLANAKLKEIKTQIKGILDTIEKAKQQAIEQSNKSLGQQLETERKLKSDNIKDLNKEFKLSDEQILADYKAFREDALRNRDGQLIGITREESAKLHQLDESFKRKMEMFDDPDYIPNLIGGNVTVPEEIRAQILTYKAHQENALDMFETGIAKAEEEHYIMNNILREDSIDEMKDLFMSKASQEEIVAKMNKIYEDLDRTNFLRAMELRDVERQVRSYRAKFGWENKRFYENLEVTVNGIRKSLNDALEARRIELIQEYAARRLQGKEKLRSELKTARDEYLQIIKEQRAVKEQDKLVLKRDIDAKKELVKEEYAQKRTDFITQKKERNAKILANYEQKRLALKEQRKQRLAKISEYRDNEITRLSEELEATQKEIRNRFADAMAGERSTKELTKKEIKARRKAEHAELVERYKQRKQALEDNAKRQNIVVYSEDLLYRTPQVQSIVKNKQVDRLRQTASWAAQNLFYISKNQASTLSKMDGTNQIKQYSQMLNDNGQALLEEATTRFALRAYEDPRLYWQHFTTFIDDYVKVISDQKNLRVGVGVGQVERQMSSMLSRIQDQLSVGMYYFAESDRLINKKLYQAMDESIFDIDAFKELESFNTTLSAYFQDGVLADQRWYNVGIREYIGSSFNRQIGTHQSYKYLINFMKDDIKLKYKSLLDANNVDEFKRAYDALDEQSKLILSSLTPIVQKMQQQGDIIIQNNKLWTKLDTDMNNFADLLDTVLGKDNERMLKAIIGDGYDEMMKVIDGGGDRLHASMMELINQTTNGRTGWQTLRNFYSGAMNAFYQGVLTWSPKFHTNNLSTGQAIVYSTTGEILGAKAIGKGTTVVAMGGNPLSLKYFDIAVTTKSGEVYTYGDIYNAIQKGGIRSEYSFAMKAFNDQKVLRYIQANTKGSVSKAANNVQNIASSMMIKEDMIFRSAVMIKALEKGMGYKDAIALAKRSLFDYNDLPDWAKGDLTSLFVFINFTWQNIKNLIISMGDVNKFKRYIRTLQFKNGAERMMEELNGDRFTPERFMPNYMLPKIRMWERKGSELLYPSATPNIPALDAMMLLSQFVQAPIDTAQMQVLSMLNPYAKMGLDLQTVYNQPRNTVSNEYVKQLLLFNQDIEATKETLQWLSGDEVFYENGTPETGVEYNGSYYVYRFGSEEGAANFQSVINMLSTVGVIRPTTEWTRLISPQGTAYAQESLPSRLLLTSTKVQSPEAQSYFSAREKQKAVKEASQKLEQSILKSRENE